MPFVDALAAGLRHRVGGDGEALSRARILLPTRRACRSLQDAFLRQSGGVPMLLPAMTPLGDVDEDEVAFSGWDETDASMETGAGLDIPPPISGLRRQLLLSTLILANKERRTTPDQAARLAGELARLLDQVHLERLSFDGLEDLVEGEMAEHWQITVRFLEILTKNWPAVLAEEGCMDGLDRRNLLLKSLAQGWRNSPPGGPVIAAGSTGSIPATADLLAVVAGLPGGAVVLPGLDRTLDAETAADLEPSHPQYGMARLLDHLGVAGADVAEWPAPGIDGVEPTRFQTIARALHPTGGGGEDFPLKPLAGVAQIDCPTSREEAGVIALALRKALETPGRRAALITPDRTLARQVQAELARWGLVVDDSAGTPLTKTPPGAFLRLTAAMIAHDLAPVPLLAALKHPLAAGGQSPGAFRARVRLLEMAALRGPRPGAGAGGLIAAVEGAETIKGKDKKHLRDWVRNLTDLAASFSGLMAAPGTSLRHLLHAHVEFAEALAATPTETGSNRLWAGDAGQAAAAFVAELAEGTSGFPPLAGRDYPALLDSLMSGRVVRSAVGRHPRLAIWGLLEARLQHADLVILGGLNEGTWPPRTDTGPWMSRPMRADFGLPLPERRIGLAAHDFVQALSAPDVLLTRATRVDGAPTLPSRWLLRLETLLGTGGIPKAADYLNWVSQLDHPGRPKPWPSPSPTPPVKARPRILSVTRIETWIRDPYALYASKILKLTPLDALDADPAAAERGSIIHDVLDQFFKTYPGDLPDDARARLLETGRHVFGDTLDRPGVRAFWWPRFQRIAHWIIDFEIKRRAAGHAPVATEADGELVLAGPAGPFTLTARADRIDRLGDGGLAIIDYKTGAPPSWSQVESGLVPQLSLEAAMAAAGGFLGVGAADVTELMYVRLSGGRKPGEARTLSKEVAEVAGRALDGLAKRIAAFDDPETPYLSRPTPMFLSRFSDYDHLARVKEWSAGLGVGGGDGE